MLELSLSAKNDFLGLINVEIFAKHLNPEYLFNYYRKRAENGIHSKLIWPKVDSFAKYAIDNSQALKMQIRILETGSEWTSGFMSWNDSLSLKSFSEGQITCTILENKDIVSLYRNIIFPCLWSQAKRVK